MDLFYSTSMELLEVWESVSVSIGLSRANR